MWIVDTKKEHLAVEEARKLRIPIIGILDTNCDPDEVDFPIPGNDDAIRAVGLLTRVIADAVAEGLIARGGGKSEGAASGTTDEPLAEWERELLAGEAEKAAESATKADDTAASEATGASSEAAASDEAAAEATEAPVAPEATEATARPAKDESKRPPRTRPRPDLSALTAVREPSGARGRRHAGVSSRYSTTFPSRDGTSMTNISAADVKKLREQTGAGMMDCKKALTEADGDLDKAVEILRVKGEAKAAKRGAEREASSGLVVTSGGALVEMRSETDFVAKNDDFVAAAEKIAAAADAAKAGDTEALKAVELDGKTVGEVVEQLAITIGEKIELGRVAYFEGPVVTYMHKRAADLPPAVGVLVEYDGSDEAARGAAMQIAAMRPQYLTPRRGPRRRRRGRALHRRAEVARGGQARAGDRQDHRGPGQRLLQGGRPPRAAVGDRGQEERGGRPQGGRHHPQALRPLRGRCLRGADPLGCT